MTNKTKDYEYYKGEMVTLSDRIYDCLGTDTGVNLYYSSNYTMEALIHCISGFDLKTALEIQQEARKLFAEYKEWKEEERNEREANTCK